MEILTAFEVYNQGIMDGLDEPHDLSSGMTYEDEPDNEIYDLGVNVGQKIGKLIAKNET